MTDDMVIVRGVTTMTIEQTVSSQAEHLGAGRNLIPPRPAPPRLVAGRLQAGRRAAYTAGNGRFRLRSAVGDVALLDPGCPEGQGSFPLRLVAVWLLSESLAR